MEVRMRRLAIAVSFGCLMGVGGVWAAEQQGTPPSMKDVPKDMGTYFVAFLVAGPKFAPGSPDHAALMPKHLAFIRRMISEKKLRLAGPFTDDGKVFGIAIIAASSLSEAKAWMEDRKS